MDVKEKAPLGRVVSAAWSFHEDMERDLSMDGSGELGREIGDWHLRNLVFEIQALGWEPREVAREIEVRTSARWAHFSGMGYVFDEAADLLEGAR